MTVDNGALSPYRFPVALVSDLSIRKKKFCAQRSESSATGNRNGLSAPLRKCPQPGIELTSHDRTANSMNVLSHLRLLDDRRRLYFKGVSIFSISLNALSLFLYLVPFKVGFKHSLPDEDRFVQLAVQILQPEFLDWTLKPLGAIGSAAVAGCVSLRAS